MENDTMTLEEAAQLTPEDVLDMHRIVAAAELNLPEAPSSMNFRAESEHGYEFMITLRDWDENRLLDRILAFGKRLNSEASISPPKGGGTKSDEPQGEIRLTSDVDPSVIEGPSVIVYKVDSLVHKIGKKGSYFKVKGGKWTQWGWNAFQDVFPQEITFGTLEKDQVVTNLPRELEYAYVDQDKKRVVAFATTV